MTRGPSEHQKCMDKVSVTLILCLLYNMLCYTVSQNPLSSPSRSIKTIKYGFKDFYKRIEWKKFSSRWSFLWEFNRKLVMRMNHDHTGYPHRKILYSICLFYWWDVFFMTAIRSPCSPSNIHYYSCVCLLSCLFIRHLGNLEAPTQQSKKMF